jgi:hypothetical protein
MPEPGYFFLAGDIKTEFLHQFVDEHREEMAALAADPAKADSTMIAGVYVEYRPNVGTFCWVAPYSEVMREIGMGNG